MKTLLTMLMAMAALVVSAQTWTPEGALKLGPMQKAPLEGYAELGQEVARQHLPRRAEVQMEKKGITLSVPPGGASLFTENGETVWIAELQMLTFKDDKGNLTGHPHSPEDWNALAAKTIEQLGAYSLAYPVLGVTELRVEESGVNYQNPGSIEKLAKGEGKLQMLFAHPFRISLADFVKLTEAHPQQADLHAAIAQALKPVGHRGLALAKAASPKTPKK